MRIEFEPTGWNDVVRFSVTGDDGSVWRDTLRLGDVYGHPAAREALTMYGFWLDLMALVGDRRPAIVCGDMALLRRLFENYRRCTARLDDPWPFADGEACACDGQEDGR